MKTNFRNSILAPWCSQALKLVALGVVFVIAASVPLPAAQLSLKHNVTQRVGGGVYQGVTDSWMEYQNAKNYGGDISLYVGEHVSALGDSIILKFDLPAVTCQSISGATLWLWYVDTYQMGYNNTALQIAPFRIKPGYSWDENTGTGDPGHGWLNHGVNYKYRDANDTLAWTSQYAGFYDSLDDGNGRPWIKRTGGTVTNAYAPQQWVPFNVQPSAAQWYGGQENNGLGLYMQGAVGSDSTADGYFAAKENTDYGPTLNITYSGAQIAWTGASSSTWDTASFNWNVGGYLGTYGDGDFVTFADGASNPGISVAGGGVSPGSVTINNNSTTYSFSSGSIGGSGGLTKQGSGTATLSASNGYGGLTLVQAGRLIVAANNALGATGSGTVVSNGAALGLQSVNYSTAEPLTISGTGISSSGALYVVSGSNTFAGAITLGADSSIGVNTNLSLTLNGAISGGFSLTKTGAGVLAFGGSSANTYGGTAWINQGTLVLAKSAGTAVPNDLVIGDGTNAATARLDAAGQLCSACDVTVRESSLLNLNGYSATIGGLTLSSGTAASGAGTLTLSGNVAGTGNQSATISGNLNLGGVTREVNVANGTADDDLVISAAVANGGILKTGAGRLVLGGNSGYDGDTVVSNGAVAVAASSALGSTTGGTTIANGARLELRGNVAVGAEALTLNGSGGGLGALRNVSDTNSWDGPITLGSAAMIESDAELLTLNGLLNGAGFGVSFNTTGDITVNGAIGGAGTALSKSGNGTLTLAGASPNTYTGLAMINQGTLALAKSSGIAVPGALIVGDGLNAASAFFLGSSQVPATCDVTVNQQSLLNLNGHGATVGSLTLSNGNVQTGAGALTMNGPVTANGSLAVSISGSLILSGASQDISVLGGGDLQIPAAISGGGFCKKGSGRLILMGTNSYTGNTIVSNGTLLIDNDPNLSWGTGPGAVTVTSGARLGGTGSICGPVTVAVNGTLNLGASVGTLIVSNTVTFQLGGWYQIEVGPPGPMPIIDQLDLKTGGGLTINNATLQILGKLTGFNAYVIAKSARSVTGTFLGLPQNAPVPANPGWFIHYGTQRIYLSKVAQPMTYFRAFSTNGVVVITWRTAEEVNVQSFDLFRWDQSWGWVPVNQNPIPAQNPNGAIYVLVDPGATPGQTYQYRLVEHTSEGDETSEYERTPTEFAFSAAPRLVAGGVELRWWGRTDEIYDLLSTSDLALPLQLLTNGLPATPPECVFTNWTDNSTQGFYRLRMLP